MNFESLQTEKKLDSLFELIELPNVIKQGDPLTLEEDKITHYFLKNRHSEGSTELFSLPTEIEALNYHFNLESMYGMHELSFTTSEYGYATTNLSEEGARELEEKLGKFIDSILATYPLRELYVKPAPESITVRDIEACIEEILLKKRDSTREQLLKEYRAKGWQDLIAEYRTLYGKGFENSQATPDRTAARARLFKMGLKRVLPDWEIEVITNQKWILKRKETSKHPFH